MGSSSRVPRTIWMLWLQGWSLQLLTLENLHAFIDVERTYPGLPFATFAPQLQGDLIRMEPLRAHGGVWADATVYCNRPLDTWIDDVMPKGFFAFARPGPDRMLSNWFLAAQPDALHIAEWQRRSLAYWTGRKEAHRYFWHHDVFAQAYEADPAFREAWDATPQISADGPHRFVPYDQKLVAPLTPEVQSEVARTDVPVFKLTHKLPDVPLEGSVLRWLEQRAYREER